MTIEYLKKNQEKSQIIYTMILLIVEILYKKNNSLNIKIEFMIGNGTKKIQSTNF